MNTFKRWKEIVSKKNPLGEAFFISGSPEATMRTAFQQQGCEPTREYLQLMSVCCGLVTHPEVQLLNELERGYYFINAKEVAAAHRQWSNVVTEYDSHEEAGLTNRYTDFILLANNEAGSYYFIPCAKEPLDDSPVLCMPKSEDCYVRYQSLRAMFETLAIAFETDVVRYEHGVASKQENGSSLVQVSEFGWLRTGILPEEGWYLRRDEQRFKAIAKRLNPNVALWQIP